MCAPSGKARIYNIWARKHGRKNTAGSALTGNTWGGKTRSRHIGGADARIRGEFGPGKTGRGSVLTVQLPEHPGGAALLEDTPVIRHPAAARSGRNTLAGVNRVQLPDRYESSSLTLAEISLPSARPASFFEAAPITLPISFIDVAPTSAITALTSAVNSSGVS